MTYRVLQTEMARVMTTSIKRPTAQSTSSEVGRKPRERYLSAKKAISAMFRNANYGSLLTELIQSPAFQRLRDIRFLGAIDYMFVPNGTAKHRRHTRYEHSLNVARLAQAYARTARLDGEHEKHLVVAALLHDIGHGPLSHSLEPVFSERFRITHHEATILILKGTVPIGATLPKIFKRHGIDRHHVLGLIQGEERGLHAEALLNPINVDTIEAILRCQSYLQPDLRHITPVRILQSLVQRRAEDIQVLDQFWELKDFVYDHLINSRVGIAADYICQEYARRHGPRFWSGDYFITESALRRQHKELFDLLEHFRKHHRAVLAGDATRLTYNKRHFYVDTNVPPTDWRGVHARYKQTKIKSEIRISDIFGSRAKQKTGRLRRDLFATEGDGGR